MYSTTTVLYLSCIIHLLESCTRLDRGTSMIFLNVNMLVWKTLLLFLPDSLPLKHQKKKIFQEDMNKNMSVLHYDFYQNI